MSSFIDFMVVTAAVITGLALAMSLEWLTLNGLLRLLPGRPDRVVANSKLIGTTSQNARTTTIHLFPR
jgi:hypothetical protein